MALQSRQERRGALASSRPR